MPVAETDNLSPFELTEAWPALSTDERVQGFHLLSPSDAETFLRHLASVDTAEIFGALPEDERGVWLGRLAPDDIADIIQQLPVEQRSAWLERIEPKTRAEVRALLAYAEDVAGGLMNPRYARLRRDMTVAEAIGYLRAQKHHQAELIHYGYVVDASQHLVGVVSFRGLVTALPEQRLSEIMRTDLVTVPDTMDQEVVSHIFAQRDLWCLPVVDAEGRMKGIVTADDIVDVVKEEATEDMQKAGGSEALGAPYLTVSLGAMIRKRGVWLAALFLGETMTATAIAYFESEISRAVVLALFIPLIISSGGNSGSQASTIVIRAMALGEVRLRDWFRVIRREIASGLALGLLLGTIGLLRVLLWETMYRAAKGKYLYGEHYVLVACTVALSVVGCVTWGTIAGSMLPFILRSLRLDPASASAPFVATLVDVTGVIIYFSVATLILSGTLL
jgi:magnesium transporter